MESREIELGADVLDFWARGISCHTGFVIKPEYVKMRSRPNAGIYVLGLPWHRLDDDSETNVKNKKAVIVHLRAMFSKDFQ